MIRVRPNIASLVGKTLWAAMGLLLVGCERGDSPAPISTVASVTPAASPPDFCPTPDGCADPELADAYKYLDPQADGWDTESFHDATSAQLKALAKKMIHPEQLSANGLAEFIEPQFACAPLRLTDLQRVYASSGVEVWRPAADAAEAEPVHRGGPGLVAAFQALAEPMAGFHERRADFKQYRVDAESDVWETWSYVNYVGRGQQASRQINSIWICRWSRPEASPPRLLGISQRDYEEVVQAGPAGSMFTDCTASALGRNDAYSQQILFGADHWRSRIERRFDVNWTGFHGLAVGDVNGDGLDDVYVCQPGGLPNKLFVRQPDGSARDVSRDAGVDWQEYTRSALFIDIDNDGDQDLVLGVPWGLVFHENDGRGVFKVRGVGLIPSEPYSLAAADYDQDSDVDIYVCCYSSGWTQRDDDRFPSPIPIHDANNGDPNVLLRSDGNWKFTEVTREVGLDVNNTRFSLSAAWEDFDNDGDLDLHVANDFGRKNLYRNDGGRFVDIAPQAGVEDSGSGMSTSWGDYDGDGLMDLYVANMFSAAGNRIAFQPRFQPGGTDDMRRDLKRHARGNSLFKNRGDGTFEDHSLDAGVTLGRWAWSSLLTDINLDGRDDILVANGYVTQDSVADL